jgi:hypothetical protein
MVRKLAELLVRGKGRKREKIVQINEEVQGAEWPSGRIPGPYRRLRSMDRKPWRVHQRRKQGSSLVSSV